ncbi:MAG: hypothetical protein E7615_03295 [Ruminococcaceae bacterium]|nr:hypothetical protein [Oscillospiraceae bacterium]
MLKRIVILLLAMMLGIGSMTSCIKLDDRSEDYGERETVETLAPSPERVPELPDPLNNAKALAEKALAGLTFDEDFKDLSLNVIIVEDTEIELGAEIETSYAKGLRMQSEIVSQKLGCTVFIRRMPYSTFLSDAQAYHDSGLFLADVICIPQKALGYMKNRGLLMELNSVYGDTFTEEYFDADAKLQGSGMNKLYGIAGDATVNPAAYTCLYLNKAMADDAGITEEIYGLVESGNWTFDAMLEYKVKIAEKYPDAFLFSSKDSGDVIEAMFGASGMKYMSTSPDGLPAVANNGDRLANLIAKLKTVLADPTVGYCAEDAYDIFGQNRSLFYIDTLQAAPSIKGDYTVLPMPKADSEQTEYYTPTSEEAYVYAVLSSNNRPEYADTLIKALNASAPVLSEGWSRDLLDYAFSNEQSYINVKSICENASYDFAYMYGDVYMSVADSTYNALKNAVLTNAGYDYYAGLQTWKLNGDMNALFS